VSRMIERVSPVPYYEQLFLILRDRILSGETSPEERLPSELELCREFGLSRATVRQALSKLESEGFARRVARRGMFASSSAEPTGWTVEEHFLESQIHHGRIGVVTTVVDAATIVPPQHVAEALRVAEGEQVYAIERVRSLDGRVAMMSTSWFPAPIAEAIATPEVLNGTGSINAALREAGYIASGTHRVIRALRATGAIAAHLETGPDQAVLRLRSLSWDAADLRFDYSEAWVLTDIAPIEVVAARR
jgi:GntR family transcriptional regulator